MPKFIGVNISGTVVGHQIPFGGTVLPPNFLWCDGASYLRTAFPLLFAAIGTAFGAADGTHFNVPDWRARFMRGSDNMGSGAAGRDPGGRVAMAVGGNATNVGSFQGDAFQGHWFTTTEIGGVAASTASNNNDGSSPPGLSNKRGLVLSLGANPVWGTDIMIRPTLSDGVNGTPRLSSESRPVNGNTNYIIAYI